MVHIWIGRGGHRSKISLFIVFLYCLNHGIISLETERMEGEKLVRRNMGTLLRVICYNRE